MAGMLWTRCYEDGWQDLIVPEAFSHPAKMARGLLVHILDHIKLKGWKADIILDPFGGIGSTGILGAYGGHQVICVELEARFVLLAEQNFALHRNAWNKLGNPEPVMIQGDSRRLCEIVDSADILISSPPYAESLNTKTPDIKIGRAFEKKFSKTDLEGWNYGQSPGQLGKMKSGDIDLVLSSPPYRGGHKGATDENSIRPPHDSTDNVAQGFAHTKGNLGNLRSGKVDMVVSSPPYEGSMKGNNIDPDEVAARKTKHSKVGGSWETAGRKRAYAAMMSGYNPENENNLGSNKGETFWSAAKEIVSQCYQILRPGGKAIFVCKDFVRKGKRVKFSDDWQKLCEVVGFKLVCRHKAMLVKEESHPCLFGGVISKITEYKSFFKRLAEAKGSPPIDHEDVICMIK